MDLSDSPTSDSMDSPISGEFYNTLSSYSIDFSLLLIYDHHIPCVCVWIRACTSEMNIQSF